MFIKWVGEEFCFLYVYVDDVLSVRSQGGHSIRKDFIEHLRERGVKLTDYLTKFADFLGMEIVVLALLLSFPQITLFLPELMMSR